MTAMNFGNYTLRLAGLSDLPAYFSLIDRNRHRLEDFFAGTVAVTKTFADTEAHLKDVIGQVRERRHYPFFVIDNNTGAVIASLQIKNLDWSIPKGEMGYYIDGAYEGKGIVRKALAKMIAWCFDELRLDKVYIRTFEGNMRSRKVAERNGLVPEGTLRMDYKTTKGEIIDLMYYGLTRDDYERAAPSNDGSSPAASTPPPIPFQIISWPDLAVERLAGDKGHAGSRALHLPGLRIRRVDYSAGYLADHWCRKGHIVHCLEGEFRTEFEDGGQYLLSEGLTYIVSDEMSSHRSWSEHGVRLLIIDGDFLARTNGKEKPA